MYNSLQLLGLKYPIEEKEKLAKLQQPLSKKLFKYYAID